MSCSGKRKTILYWAEHIFFLLSSSVFVIAERKKKFWKFVFVHILLYLDFLEKHILRMNGIKSTAYFIQLIFFSLENKIFRTNFSYFFSAHRHANVIYQKIPHFLEGKVSIGLLYWNQGSSFPVKCNQMHQKCLSEDVRVKLCLFEVH